MNFVVFFLFSFQGLLLGLLLYLVVLKYLLCGWDGFSRSTYSGARICSEKGKSLIFFASLGFLIVVIIPSWMQFVQDFDIHPLLWYYYLPQHLLSYKIL
jgi:dolichol kinase